MEPAEIVRHMMHHDAFSQWLGIEVAEVREGYCRLRMPVRADMLNGFYILHGGVAFALADSCFAFASNSRGMLSVSLQAGMNYLSACKEGDVLIAESKEIALTRSSAHLDIEIRKEGDCQLCSLFRGVAHRMQRPTFEDTP
jgi:acyl-CoA thioesterase